MKKIIFLLIMLFCTIILFGCGEDITTITTNTIPTTTAIPTTTSMTSPTSTGLLYGDASFLGVEVSDLKPDEAKNIRELSYQSRSDLSTLQLSDITSNDSNRVHLLDTNDEILNIEYDGFFTLIIDIDNPNNNSIYEIRIMNNATGNTYTYQPSQKEDLDEDGTLDDLFYVNRDISTIFLGIKLSKEHAPGDTVSYTIQSITYFEIGVIKYVQMDPQIDPAVTINIQITNMIFGVEFDKSEYVFDNMRGIYDDVYVMLSVYNEARINLYSVNFTINGVEKTYPIASSISSFRQSELDFNPTCPESYDSRYCTMKIIAQIPGEDIAAIRYTENAVTIINEYGSHERTDKIAIDVLGINSSQPKDVPVYDDVIIPTVLFKNIEDSESYTINMEITASNDFQNIIFDFSQTFMSDISPIYVRLYEINNYALEPWQTPSEIIFDEYGYSDNVDEYILLTDPVTTINFDLGHYQYAAVFVDENGNPINDHYSELLVFDSVYDTSNFSIPNYTITAIEDEQDAYIISIDISEYLTKFDLLHITFYSSIHDKWVKRYDIQNPVSTFTTLTFEIYYLSPDEEPDPKLKVRLIIADDNFPGTYITIEHIILITLPEE